MRPTIRLVPPSASCPTWRAKYKDLHGIVHVAQGTSEAEAVYALLLACDEVSPVTLVTETN